MANKPTETYVVQVSTLAEMWEDYAAFEVNPLRLAQARKLAKEIGPRTRIIKRTEEIISN